MPSGKQLMSPSFSKRRHGGVALCRFCQCLPRTLTSLWLSTCLPAWRRLRSLQDLVSERAEAQLGAATLPGVLSACRHLASLLPPAAPWAAHVQDMAAALRAAALRRTWASFAEVALLAGQRCGRGGAWETANWDLPKQNGRPHGRST